MRASKEELPMLLKAGEATIRGADWEDMRVAIVSVPAGTDFGPLLEGHPDDRCPSPHWGYVVKGAITALYADGSEETSSTGDLFYWPPGHSVRAEDDTDIVMFSPQHEHGAVIEHIRRQGGD